MEQEITKEDKDYSDLCETIWHGKEKFVKRMLDEVVSYRIWIGYTVRSSSSYRKYGESLVYFLAKDTGISKTVIYESVKMIEKEKLSTPEKQKEFISLFPSKYPSWGSYLSDRLTDKNDVLELSAGGNLQHKGGTSCKGCSLHCPGYLEVPSQIDVSHVKIESLITLWKEVNPAYLEFYKNKTERNALQWIVDQYGEERTRQMIAFLPVLNQTPYAPKATSPYQLKMKMADIQSWVAKKGNEIKGKSKIGFE